MDVEQIISNDLNLHKKGSLYYCFSGTHVDKRPSMSFWRSQNKFHCFACGFNYDIYDHKKNGYKNINIPSQPYNTILSYSKPRSVDLFKNIGKYINNYFKARKIDLNDFKYLNLRQSKYYKTIVYPIYSEYGEHISNKYRNVDTKEIYFDKNTNCKTLYNINNTDFERPLFIAEGESDLLSVLTAFKQTTFKNVVSLVTGVNSKLTPNMISILKKYPEVVLCFDNDDPGREGQQKLYKILMDNNINCTLFNWDGIKYKDLNEVLVNTSPETLKKMLIKSCKYRKRPT